MKTRQEKIKDKLDNMVVHGWIFDDLNLKGNEVLVYAAFYATRTMKLKVTEADLIYGHLKISSSTFYSVRISLYKKGLVDITDDGKEKYYDVKDPALLTSEKAVRIAARYEQNSAVRSEMSKLKIAEQKESQTLPVRKSTEETSSQLTFFKSSSHGEEPRSDDVAKSELTTQAESDGSPAIVALPGTSQNSEPGEQLTMDKSSAQQLSAPQPETASISEPEPMTQKSFCDKWNVESDGTEDTEGIDWDVLDFEFGRSAYLRTNSNAHILKIICERYETLSVGYWSDEAIAKMKAEREKANGKTAETNTQGSGT